MINHFLLRHMRILSIAEAISIIVLVYTGRWFENLWRTQILVRWLFYLLATAAGTALFWEIFKRARLCPKLVILCLGSATALLMLAQILSPAAAEEFHLLVYSILGGTIYLSTSPKSRKLTQFCTSLVIASAVGILDETLQGFTAGRVFDPRDLFFNFVGAAAGILVAFVFSYECTKSGAS